MISLKNIFQIRVSRQGTITLPKALCERDQIIAGDALSVVDMGSGVLVISKKRSQVDEIADHLAQQLLGAGESLETMLDALRNLRTEHNKLP